MATFLASPSFNAFWIGVALPTSRLTPSPARTCLFVKTGSKSV
eukprot:CAMPEP_0198510494 /NCGR_PEP_ID=MMETSP1462-20131121/14215_1 /TAXON_ID=1333877 /ORGANISM="Brandtodinium nutriculum, Strain RCC3387" /LENGTH=42 /DNA_ID= /DNA_START= /DNA_END= /DNA_ORIENTATION=